jgi:hypothetical protein
MSNFSWRNVLLFGCFGSGANWVLVTILYQQVPFFQRHQPEGLCMATYMTVVSCCSLFVTIAYCYAHNVYHLLPSTFMIPLLLMITFIGTIFSALTYQYTVANSSMFLLISIFFGSAVGSLQSVILNPFMTKYENLYISCARGGASLCFVISSLLSIAQSPGNDPRYSPKIFLLVFSVILFFPLPAYREIMTWGIGLKSAGLLEGEQPRNESAVEVINIAHLIPHGSKGSSSPHILEESHGEEEAGGDSARGGKGAGEDGKFWWLVPREHRRELFPHMAAVGLVQFVTWGLLQSATPFAFDFVMSRFSGSGSFYLAIAYEIGTHHFHSITPLTSRPPLTHDSIFITDRTHLSRLAADR